MYARLIAAVFVWVVTGAQLLGQSLPSLEVTRPPRSFFQLVDEKDREVAREFYTKYVDINGMPVAASSGVADEALIRTHSIVRHMLAGRPDIVQALIDRRMYLIVIGKDQVYTDMPEYRHHPNPEFQNERVRGTGGRPTSFGEENLLSLPFDRYDDESIAVHEFCHTIDGALGSIDPDWDRKKQATFRQAIAKGLYANTYAASNATEYWAEIAQAYFDCNRVNNWNHGVVGTREQLENYDPDGYELVRSVFNLRPEQDWRYTWLQTLPTVETPPDALGIDPYYTKLTWAREFPVISRNASNASLLKANDIIRKMFAYRHDILKALINDGARLVVLGPDEKLADLPECKALTGRSVDLLSRSLDYLPETKLIVVDAKNVLASPRNHGVAPNQVIKAFAVALYRVTGARPIDPNWNDRGMYVQQYELHVKRLDVEFGSRVKELYEEAIERGKWKGTSLVHDAEAYWAGGVLAYFDASGQDAAPPDAAHPIRNRELLQQYDPALHQLVSEVMAYEGHVDWRYRPVDRE